MPIPPVGYILDIPGHPKQSLPKSDWPLYAAVSALGVGNYYGPLASQGEAALRQWLNGQDIPNTRLDLWQSSLTGQKLSTSATWDTRFPPMAHQDLSVKEMSDSGGVLALGCSLGKTLTTEHFLGKIHTKYRGKPLVIASTRTALDGATWTPYLPRFKAMGFSEVFKVSIDSLHKFVPGFRSDGGVLVFDEGHLLGGTDARRTKLAMELRLKMDVALVLTGTLFHCGILRGLNAMNLAIPGLAGFSSQYGAASYFNAIEAVHYKEKKLGKGGEPLLVDVTKHKVVKPTGEHETRFKEFVTKRFVVSLAKRSPVVMQSMNIPDQDQETMEFNGPWRTVHDDSVIEIRRAIEAGEGIPHASAVRHALAQKGLEDKAAWLLEKLEDKEPLVVLCKYTDSLNYIEQEFKNAGITYARIDGTVTGADRAGVVEAFQRPDGPLVLLGQFEATGISVELTRASTSVGVESTWRPDAYDQALARTCRHGQLKRCRHIDLVANRLQESIVSVVRSGRSFDAGITEFQDTTRALRAFSESDVSG